MIPFVTKNVPPPPQILSHVLPGRNWFARLFDVREGSYEATKALFQVEHDGARTLLRVKETGATFDIGSFSTPSLAELRQRRRPPVSGEDIRRLTLSTVIGDVSALHVEPENKFATFQVASQFNCLEFAR